MLKLRYLFSNIELATTAVENWKYDDLEYFKYFRISASAIYPFCFEGQVMYLRLIPSSETKEDQMVSQVQLLDHLNEKDYPAMELVRSNGGNLVELLETPWGGYYATVSKRVSGIQLSEAAMTEELSYAYGRSLAEFHLQAVSFKPDVARIRTYSDVLAWIRERLEVETVHQSLLIGELEAIDTYFKTLDRTKENFGLIHYDYEMDNVFYEAESNTFSVIDFGDIMLHFYMQDIENALSDLGEELPYEEKERLDEAFIRGYESRKRMSGQVAQSRAYFKRFGELYQYARICYSVEEELQDEPEWMVGLREKLRQKTENFLKQLQA